MFWLYYYILPAIAAWKWRDKELVSAVYHLYGTMLSAFLAVWCEAPVRTSVTQLLGRLPFLSSAWARPIAMVLIWFIAFSVWVIAVKRLAPEGLDDFTPPEKVSKIATPVVIFLHGGVVCALVFTILSTVPLKAYTSFITDDPELCSGARYRLLWNSFFIDRASFQPTSWTVRRSAFDRFVPREPQTSGK